MDINDTMLIMSELSYYPSKDGLYATIKYGERMKSVPVTGKEFNYYITTQYFNAYGDFPEDKEIKNCLKVIECNLNYSNDKDTLFSKRYTYEDDTIYINMANNELQHIEVTTDGYEIIDCIDDEPLFTKDIMTAPMEVLTVEEADSVELLSDLDEFINLSSDDLFLFKVWIVASMHPEINMPLLYLLGGAGTGKSSIQDILGDLVDPSARGREHWEEISAKELAITLDKSYLVTYDNVSKISRQKSDILCQSVTGGNIIFRKLYTDNEEMNYNLRTRLCISSVENCIAREDLGTRTLFMNVPILSGKKRISEDDFRKKYRPRLPYMLSDALFILSTALARYEEWKQTHYSFHRLASFEVFGSLVADILDEEHGYERFQRIMKSKHIQQIFIDENDSLFFTCMLNVLDDIYEGEFKGGTKRLYNAIIDELTVNEEYECYSDEIIIKYDRFAKMLHTYQTSFPIIGYELNFEKRTKDNMSAIRFKKIVDDSIV